MQMRWNSVSSRSSADDDKYESLNRFLVDFLAVVAGGMIRIRVAYPLSDDAVFTEQSMARDNRQKIVVY